MISKKLVDTLVKMHHHRIRYPWQEASEQRRSSAADPRGDATDEEVQASRRRGPRAEERRVGQAGAPSAGQQAAEDEQSTEAGSTPTAVH